MIYPNPFIYLHGQLNMSIGFKRAFLITKHTHFLCYTWIYSLESYIAQDFWVAVVVGEDFLIYPTLLPSILALAPKTSFLLVLGDAGQCPCVTAMSFKCCRVSRVSTMAGILGLSLGLKLMHCNARRAISFAPFTEYCPASLGSIMYRNLRVLVR